MPILKDFHRNYRSALLMDNFKLIYRYDKERDEIVIVDIWYIQNGISYKTSLDIWRIEIIFLLLHS